MNIAIISIYSTPYGMAATNRIFAYSKGLMSNGNDVTIYNPFPTDRFNYSQKLEHKGIHEGVKFIYTSGRYLFKNRYFRLLWRVFGIRRLKGYYTSAMTLNENSKHKKIDFLIISTDSIRNLLYYSVLSKILKIKSVFIFDEFPIPIRHKLKIKIPIWKAISYKIVLKNIDLYISISSELSNYYNNFCRHETFILPVIVDVSRFESMCNNKTLRKEEYLCYMGNMDLAKDDVDNIIVAFSKIKSDFKNINLFLFGNPSEETKKELNSLIIKFNLENRVFLKGRVSASDVPKILIQAKVLVSSQPNTVRASGGFPTKLGEYLVSGTPALFTDVGENSKYVKNGVHLFFVQPENPDLYAVKLKEILDDYEKSLKIAKKGKAFIYENYSHNIQGKHLANFLKSKNKNKNEE